MASAEAFRGFVNEQLAAAAEEIFGVFVKCVREYQEEIDRQRRLLDYFCKPEMSPRIELQEQDVCMETALTERNLSMDPEPPPVKEEPEEVCTSQDGELLVLKEETDIQETDTLMPTPTYEESDSDEDPTLGWHSDEPLRAAQEESVVSGLVMSSTVGEQPLFSNSHVADSQHENSGSSGDTESKSSNEQHKGKSRNETEHKQAMTQTNMKEEGEIDPQNRRLDVAWKPTMKLQPIELRQQQVCKEEEEGLTDQQVCSQEGKSTIDRRDPQPPQVKEQQEEVCISQEERQLTVKVESNTFMMTLIYEENGKNQDQTPDLNASKSRSAPQKESIDRKPVINSVVEAPVGDPLLSNNSPVAESRDQKVEPRGKEVKVKPKCRNRNDTSEKSYNCKMCGRHFRQSSVLSIHMRTHTGAKPYICATCGKCFRHNSSLKAHVLTHTGEKPYICKTCGKLFRQNGQLKIHTRTHTGEQPYACETCGQHFTHVNALKVHVRTHTGEKPCVCKICGERFRQSGQLTAHVRKAHSGQKPFVCKA